MGKLAQNFQSLSLTAGAFSFVSLLAPVSICPPWLASVGFFYSSTMPTTITPETAKKIKRLMWVHVLLTLISLAVLGYMSWWVWNALSQAPGKLIYFAAFLFIVRELLRGYWKLYEHWVALNAGARASGRSWWRWLY